MSNEFFMAQALLQAERALQAGEFPVGCVITFDVRIIATGSRNGTKGLTTNELDHAEMIALRRLTKRQSPVDLSKVIVFSTLEPCLMCFGALLIAGIRHFVYAYEDAMGGGTGCNLQGLPPLYNQAKISLVPHILREKSLALFKVYFNNPANTYLSDSYLADYTLRQPLRSPPDNIRFVHS